jgi:hypothetical protein
MVARIATTAVGATIAVTGTMMTIAAARLHMTRRAVVADRRPSAAIARYHGA